MCHKLRAAALKSIHLCIAAGSLAGCTLLTPPSQPTEPVAVIAPARPDPAAPRLTPLDTRHFELAPKQELVGETQVLFARYENTFSAIGRQYNLGYEEMRRANPGVDQWLPGEGTPVYLPTQTILPDAPRTGIVVNVPAFALYAFDGTTRALTMPVVVGDELASRRTPIFADTMEYIQFGPYWNVPRSIAVNEVLPQARRDRGYLARNYYQILRGWGDDAPVVNQRTLSVAALFRSAIVFSLPGIGTRSGMNPCSTSIPSFFSGRSMMCPTVARTR